MLKKHFTITTLSLLSLSLLTITINSLPVLAKNELKINQRQNSEISKILANIEEKDPQKIISQKLSENKNDQNELVSDQKNLQIKFSLKDKKVKIENKNKGDLTIGIPNKDQFDSVDLVDEKVIYSGKNTDVIMEAVDGGMRQIINIKDKTAPNFYDFPVELQMDEKLEINSDGSASLTKPFTQEQKNKFPKDLPKDVKIPKVSTKLSIAKPWAKDANGKDLTTNYSVINGNILRQRIDLKDAAFPVVADPTWCGNQIHSVQWQDWKNPISLGVIPTYCGRFLATDNWDAWSEMYNMTPYHWQWNWSERAYGTSKYWSMYDQLLCHYDNPVAQIVEGEWNLEPSRPNVGRWETYAAFCNP